jgi:hypothetical protein
MEPRTIFIDAHAMRRHDRMSALKECLAAVLLLQAGWSRTAAFGLSLLSAFNWIVGLGLLGVGAVEIRRGKKFGAWVRWFDISVGVLLLAEALKLATEGHHRQVLINGYYVLGAVYVLMGMFHHQLGRRRYVRIDDDGIQVRLNPFRHFRLKWPDISRVVGHPDSIDVFAKGNQRFEIARRFVPNLDEIRDLMLERASGRGIATK